VASGAEIAAMKERLNTGIPLSRDDREVIAGWSRSRTLPARVVLRSRIILMLGANRSATVVAAALGVAAATVRLWRGRFLEYGPGGLLKDAPGRGRKPALDLATREALRSGVGVLSVRRRARELGVSAATVSRWRRRRE
jgi:transposase-like protein